MRNTKPRVAVLAFASLALIGCPPPPPPESRVEQPVAAALPPPLDAAQVLKAITENAPSVEVSLRVKSPHEVDVELGGAGAPPIALALLGSLTQRLPNTRARKVQLDANTWTASLTTSSIAAPDDPTALPRILAASQPVFGDPASPLALLSSGTIEAEASKVSFQGALAPGKSIGDAGGAVAPGFALTKVASGPPFVLEIAPSVSGASGAAAPAAAAPAAP